MWGSAGSHLDRTSLLNERFVIWPKNCKKIVNSSSISEEEVSCTCVKMPESEHIYFWFCLAPSYVRLTGGSVFNNGRVEIYHQGAWGPVCRDGWSQEDSSVACRELGFNKSLPLGNAGNSIATPLSLFLTCFGLFKFVVQESFSLFPGAWLSCYSVFTKTEVLTLLKNKQIKLRVNERKWTDWRAISRITVLF